jgi:cold shock CspA family protein
MATGIVKFFNPTKNFGFIVDDKEIGTDGNKVEYFVHGSKVIGQIQENDQVSYDVGE